MIGTRAKRSRLLAGCGSAALALGLLLASGRAEAQAFNATPTVAPGNGTVTFDRTTPNVETITVASRTAIIDWTPTPAPGPFLPNGATATFQNGPAVTNFAVLNRIAGSNPAEFNGAVISRLVDAVAGTSTPGGFVAFYAPSGILVGSTATFDVGQLLLTTLAPTPASFADFAENGGTMNLAAPTAGATARIQINPGAQITATQENSFFAAVAADVRMRGTSNVNGSQAFVAGEVVNLSFSNGLFDITIPTGTAAAELSPSISTVLELGGTIGGPASTGVGDNHMIYGVMRAVSDPISMLVTGNLGFGTAQSASIVNGEIILAANYNVTGRTVNGGSVSQGINAEFNANAATSSAIADITLRDLTATSSVLAIGTRIVEAYGSTAPLAVTGNLMLVAPSAQLGSSPQSAQDITISGDVLAYSRAFGGSANINATGGTAVVGANFPGVPATVTINGNVRVTADAFAGNNGTVAGTATGGTAEIFARRGTLAIGGSALVSAQGLGTTATDILTGAAVNGGTAIVSSTQSGNVTVGGTLDVVASAIGTPGSLFGPSTGSETFGGIARISASSGGRVTATGATSVRASAAALGSSGPGAGAVGDGGLATVTAINPNSTVTFNNTLVLEAIGTGGSNINSTGGAGIGGSALMAASDGGGITVATGLTIDAAASGGFGRTGGAGTGGTATAQTFGGGSIIVESGTRLFRADGTGGEGTDGGGLGQGGTAGADAAVGTIELRGTSATAQANGTGGRSTQTFDGAPGGDGIGGIAFFSAGGGSQAGGTLRIGTDALVQAGGLGGSALPFGVAGGNGLGGDASITARNLGLITIGRDARGRGGCQCRRIVQFRYDLVCGCRAGDSFRRWLRRGRNQRLP
jgi:filamentous hemagglutinin family protein